MVVKDKVGRRRYIVFHIETEHSEPFGRNEVIYAIKGSLRRLGLDPEHVKPWLTVFANNYGILRCAHTAKDDAIECLRAIRTLGRGRHAVVVHTLGTSGTIKAAKRKYLT